MEATGGNAKRRRPPPPPPGASRRRSSVRLRDDEAAAIQELAQAAAAAIIQQQQQNGGSGMAPPFDRSASLRYQKKQSGNGGDLPRSMSTRPRLAGDPVVQPQQLLNQVLVLTFDFIYFSIMFGCCLVLHEGCDVGVIKT